MEHVHSNGAGLCLLLSSKSANCCGAQIYVSCAVRVIRVDYSLWQRIAPLFGVDSCAGPAELHEQRREELILHNSGTTSFLRSADYPEGHDGAGEPRWERGECTSSCLKFSHAATTDAAHTSRCPSSAGQASEVG